MAEFALKVAFGLVVFVGMEGFAWFMHRFVMHGWLWCWHRGHHQPRTGWFELNDLFAIVFSLPAIACFWIGRHNGWWTAAGTGITGYGVAYFAFHDGLVHRRFPVPMNAQSAFWRPRLQAHRLHHAVHTKHGCVSYGFLSVLPIRRLKAQLSATMAAGGA